MKEELEAMFYSQTIDKPQRDNTCAKCEKTFQKWSDYHTHVTTVKCMTPRQSQPVSSRRNLNGVKEPLSDERRNEIVQRWEAKQKPGVIING